MDSFNFKHFLASLGALSLEQRHGLGQALKGLEHAESALQRCRCLGGRKTFNALTGTPLRRLRHKSKWLPI